jgi:hypothetical protein
LKGRETFSPFTPPFSGRLPFLAEFLGRALVQRALGYESMLGE